MFTSPRPPFLRLSGNRFFLPALALMLFGAACSSGVEPPVDIGTRRELFVDRLLIERLDGVELRLHAPQKAPRPKSPLPVRHMMTVIKDGDIYRAWYRDKDPSYTGDNHTGNPGETVHYAESKDGHEWTFPNLGLHEVAGTRANNAILAQFPPFLTNFMPFLDTRPGVPAAERYKALAGYPGAGNKVGLNEAGRGLFAFVSPDGIHWTKRAEAIRYRPEWRHAFDSPNVAFWSEAEQCYVCFFRTWSEGGKIRSVSRASSKDFITWSDPVEMLPNLPGEHLYTTMTHPYVRAPHIYIALPTRFVPGRGNAPQYDAKDVNVTDVLFMSARPGAVRYDRLFTEAFIRPGLDVERWGNRANYVAQNVVQTGPTELSIYHRSGNRYVIRPDGFISVHAGTTAGELLTKPLIFAGRTLRLNYSTGAAGSVQVEIQDEWGRPLPGFALEDCEIGFGDRLDGAVSWKSGADLSQLAGRPVRLRFRLQECDLFALRFAAD
jgi:hypothetical protein